MPRLTPGIPGRLTYIQIEVPDVLVPHFTEGLARLCETKEWEKFDDLNVGPVTDLAENMVSSIHVGTSQPTGETGIMHDLTHIILDNAVEFLMDAAWDMIIIILE